MSNYVDMGWGVPGSQGTASQPQNGSMGPRPNPFGGQIPGGTARPPGGMPRRNPFASQMQGFRGGMGRFGGGMGGRRPGLGGMGGLRPGGNGEGRPWSASPPMGPGAMPFRQGSATPPMGGFGPKSLQEGHGNGAGGGGQLPGPPWMQQGGPAPRPGIGLPGGPSQLEMLGKPMGGNFGSQAPGVIAAGGGATPQRPVATRNDIWAK